MIRKIFILGSVLAIAGVAQAAPVQVSLQGKSQSAIRADLLKAAKQVCNASNDPLDSDSDYQQCVSDTYQAALFKLKQAMVASSEPSADKVASR
jgi:hypothetical protein